MPSKGDRDFALLAGKRKYIDREQFREALAALARAEASGEAVTIEQVMLDRGFLDAAQVLELQRLQKRRIAVCSCGNRMNVFKYEPGKKLHCSACKMPFEVPALPSAGPEAAGGQKTDDVTAVTVHPGRPAWREDMEFGFAPGQPIGRYEILEELGAGGMGVVYKVRHTLLDRVDAMKVIRPDVAGRIQYRTLFLREARVSASLRHPGLTQVYDIIDEGGVLAFSMQFVDGETLSRILERGAVEPGKAMRWTEEIAEALGFLHSEGLVHRDVKPSNIMIDSKERAILTDFGFAKNFEEAGTSGVTKDDVPLGTPAFMAPEQIDNARYVDHRADIYSTGATLYSLLAGKPPFTGETPLEIYGKVIMKSPPKLSSVAPGVPAELEALVDRMMAKDLEARIQTAGELAEALRALRAEIA